VNNNRTYSDQVFDWIVSVFIALFKALFKAMISSRAAHVSSDYIAMQVPGTRLSRSIGRIASTCRYCQTEIPHIGSFSCPGCQFRWHGNAFARCPMCGFRVSWLDCPKCGGSHRP
jgi:hypothetical protein